jgi:hypothetical protein
MKHIYVVPTAKPWRELEIIRDGVTIPMPEVIHGSFGFMMAFETQKAALAYADGDDSRVMEMVEIEKAPA